MKRLFCAALAVFTLFLFTGCGKKAKPPETLDLEYFVRLGKIPECECVLGVSAEEIEQKAEHLTEQNGLICIEKDDALYCYEKGDESKTVKYIVSLKGAYGFLPDTEISAITEELAKGEMKAPALPLEKEEIFYLAEREKNEEEYYGIKYTYGVNTTCFVFLQNRLYACTMY